jgi:hypothetical protein
MIPRSVVEYDARDSAPEMLAELMPWIERSAAKITQNATLAEDLVQEASIQLWQMDPSRFDAGDMKYVKGVLYKHMQDVVRADVAARGGKNWQQVGSI